MHTCSYLLPFLATHTAHYLHHTVLSLHSLPTSSPPPSPWHNAASTHTHTQHRAHAFTLPHLPLPRLHCYFARRRLRAARVAALRRHALHCSMPACAAACWGRLPHHPTPHLHPTFTTDPHTHTHPHPPRTPPRLPDTLRGLADHTTLTVHTHANNEHEHVHVAATNNLGVLVWSNSFAPPVLVICAGVALYLPAHAHYLFQPALPPTYLPAQYGYLGGERGDWCTLPGGRTPTPPHPPPPHHPTAPPPRLVEYRLPTLPLPLPPSYRRYTPLRCWTTPPTPSG